MTGQIDLEAIFTSEQRTEHLPYYRFKDVIVLSEINRHFHALFKPDILKHMATKLLSHVVNRDFYQANLLFQKIPALLFIEATADELAYGVEPETNKRVYRRVQLSPLRAMAAGGDKWMLDAAFNALANYKDEKTNRTGYEIAAEQIKLQFPDGFKCPPCTYDFNLLSEIISEDVQLIDTGQPNQATVNAINKFKKDFIPNIVRSGYLFNLNNFHNALQTYSKTFFKMEHSQINIFWFNIVVYLGGLFPTVFNQLLIAALKNSYSLTKVQQLRIFEYKYDDEDSIMQKATSRGIINTYHDSIIDYIQASEKHLEDYMERLQEQNYRPTCVIL